MQNDDDKLPNQNLLNDGKLPPPSPRIVNAAFEGFKLAYDLQNTFNTAIGVPLEGIPSDEALSRRAEDLIAEDHSLMDYAFAIGKMYNAIRGQQQQSAGSNCSSSVPKPNV